MNNRNEIRWAPFESIFHTKEILKEMEEKKSKHQKPILSEDELEIIQKNILEAIHTKTNVKILFYYNGKNYIKKGRITTILKQNGKIIFEDHTSLYFEQILELKCL